MPVVVRREEVTICTVADHPHVDPISIPNVIRNDLGPARVECLHRRPPARVADIGIGRIRRVVVLENEVPELLRSEVEHLRGRSISCPDTRLIEVNELRRARDVPVGKVGVKEAPVASLRSGSKDVVAPVVVDDGGVFNSRKVAAV